MKFKLGLALSLALISISVMATDNSGIFSDVIEKLSNNDVMGHAECKKLLKPDDVILGEYKMDSGENAFLVAPESKIQQQEMVHNFGEPRMVINGKRYRIVQPDHKEDKQLCAQNSKFKHPYNGLEDKKFLEKVVCFKNGKASFCKSDSVISRISCGKNQY